MYSVYHSCNNNNKNVLLPSAACRLARWLSVFKVILFAIIAILKDSSLLKKKKKKKISNALRDTIHKTYMVPVSILLVLFDPLNDFLKKGLIVTLPKEKISLPTSLAKRGILRGILARPSLHSSLFTSTAALSEGASNR